MCLCVYSGLQFDAIKWLYFLIYMLCMWMGCCLLLFTFDRIFRWMLKLSFASHSVRLSLGIFRYLFALCLWNVLSISVRYILFGPGYFSLSPFFTQFISRRLHCSTTRKISIKIVMLIEFCCFSHSEYLPNTDWFWFGVFSSTSTGIQLSVWERENACIILLMWFFFREF